MKKEIKAYIKKEQDALWLIIEGEDKTAYPITEEEVKPISVACYNYLRENDENN